MTDAGDAAAERAAKIAALRAETGPPVQGARILAAGISGSLLLGLMAWMGWADQKATTAPVTPAVGASPIVTAAPTPPTTSPTTPPNTASPATSSTPAPIEIPVATPPPTTALVTVAPPVATTQPSG